MALRIGGAGADRLIGTSRGDILLGNGGDDNLNGGGGGDILRGDGGRDALVGGAGNDILIAGPGDDYLSGDQGSDTLIGGAGWDRASWFLEPATTIDLQRGFARNETATDTVSGIEDVSATLYDDVIVGDGNANRLHGDYGRDTMTGGGGADDFLYDDRAEFGDTITDFVSGTDELIFHRNEVWPIDAPDPGRLSGDNLVVGEGPGDTDDWFILDPDTGLLLWDGDGTGPLPMLAVATFTGGTPQAADILLA